MSWDRPAPTITTKFISISNGRFGHPEEHRAISIREGATLQTFPKNYVFLSTSICEDAKMIGNAVPPEYAKRIGQAIVNSKSKHWCKYICNSYFATLKQKLQKRLHTVMPFKF
jgi:DNA (cytosine-5)-methyltransferase 1